MNQVSQAESESSAAVSSQFSLVQMRESQGLSLEQVATSLRLPVAQVKALEEGDYGKLSSVVFTRGYLRSYARLLGVNGDDLVLEFDKNYGGGQASASIRSITRVQPSGSSGPGVSLSMLLLVVVIVATTFWWWKTQYGHEVVLTSPPESTVSVDTANGETLVLSAGEPEPDFAEPEPGLDKTAPQLSSGEAAVSTEAATVQAEAALSATGVPPAVTAVADVATVGAAQTVVATATQEAPAPDVAADPESDVAATDAAGTPATSGLLIRFSDDCWVTIKSATGKTLFNNLRKAGEELRIDQAGPLNILLGRTNAVSDISFDGAAVDLGPFNNKNVARLTLPLN
uniref:RodZ domain-containing protein n=1 Tax=Marinobacterium profundum TaxID=1714300 RepID=UPI00083761FE|nr:helix-turn-helix domain-containing protein [Marinobacterium profundum]